VQTLHKHFTSVPQTGVTIIELILSELLLYSIIALAQVVVIVTIIYGIFDVSFYCNHLVTRKYLLQVEQHGNIALASFIYWLIGLSGVQYSVE